MMPDAVLLTPTIERQASYDRVRPEAITEFATELTALITEIRGRHLGPVAAQRLDTLLGAFEELLVEIRDTRRALR